MKYPYFNFGKLLYWKTILPALSFVIVWVARTNGSSTERSSNISIGDGTTYVLVWLGLLSDDGISTVKKGWNEVRFWNNSIDSSKKIISNTRVIKYNNIGNKKLINWMNVLIYTWISPTTICNTCINKLIKCLRMKYLS